MTVVASWFDLSKIGVPTIWTASDTMISDSNGGTYTLQGAKVLELPIRCKNLSTPAQPVYFQRLLGFAYAGSTLRALNCYATLSAILTNLGGGNEIHPRLPDFKSIILKAKEVLEMYVIGGSPCEICIYGICPKTNTPFIGTVISEMIKCSDTEQQSLQHTVEFHTPREASLSFILLGSHKVEIKQIIDDELEKHSSTKASGYWRAPVRMLERIVRDNRYCDIGGDIQLNILNEWRSDMMHVSNKGDSKFRNLSLFEDIGRMVGDSFIAINGMLYNFGLDEEGYELDKK